MSFLSAIFKGTTFSSAGWIGYLIIASAIYAGGAASGNFARVLLDAPTIAGLHSDVSNEQAKTAKQVARYDTLWAQTQSAMQEVEAARADANVSAANQSAKSAVTIAALQSQLTKTETDRAKTSAQLTSELNNAKSSDDRKLGPASLAYFDGLRQRQAGASPVPASPSPQGSGNPN